MVIKFLKNKLLPFVLLTVFLPFLHAGESFFVDLGISLNIQETVVEAGQPFTNNITIKNNNPGGGLDAAGSVVTYTIPSGGTFNSYSGQGWSCSHASTTATCTYDNHLYNGITSNVLTLLINAPSTGSTATSSASVALPYNADDITDNNSASATVKVGRSNLSASKTASKATLSINEEFSYTINISNPSHADAANNPTATARNVTISDALPSGIQFISFGTIPTGFNCSESSETISCSGLNLAVGDSKSLTINTKAITASSSGGPTTNTAAINTDSGDYNTMPLNVSANVNIQTPDIVLTSSLVGGISTNSAGVDSEVTYKLNVKNIGASPATGVTVINTYPTGVTLVSYSSATDWNCNPEIISGKNALKCTLTDASLIKDEAYDLNIKVKMPSTAQTAINNATASTTSSELNTANNSSSLTTNVVGTDLNIVKTPKNGNADIGSNYTYTITTTNASSVAAKSVVVTDTLDSRMTYVSDTGGCSVSGQVLTCGGSSNNIVADGNWTFNVTVRMPDTDSPNTVTNAASVTTTTVQQNSTNLSDTATTNLSKANLLDITKTASPTNVGVGKTFTYTINVKNTSSKVATDANIEDTLPSGISITGITSNDGWSCRPTSFPITGTFNCTKASVSASANSSIIFNAEATATGNNKINTATISHSLNSNDGTATATVNVTGVAITINKTASPTAVPGGVIDYNITVANNSLADAKNVNLTDNLTTSLGAGYNVNNIISSGGMTCSGSTTLTCTKATLAVGASSTVHFNVNVPSSAAVGSVKNTASVTTTAITTALTDAANTLIQGADIVVSTPSTITATANKNAIFSVTVRNDGSATAKDVSITNYFNTANITNGDFTDIKIDCNGGTNYTTATAPYTCSLGDIAKNGSKTITISATAPNYDSIFPGNSNITNKSVVTTTTSESNTANNTKEWPVNVHGADVVVYKSANKSEVAVGGEVTYTLNVKNQREADATNIVLTDKILDASDPFTLETGSLSYNHSDWTCTTPTATEFTCTYGSALINHHTTSNITINATAPTAETAIGLQKNNTANITTDTAESDTATTNDVTTPVYIRGADLNITKTVNPTSVALGGAVTYTINVTNTGLADAKNAYVDDTLPAGFTNISTSGCTNDASSVSGQVVHCVLGDITQNATKPFTITTNAPNENKTFTNTATTSSDTAEKITTNNTASADLDVKGANLVIQKFAPGKVAGNSTYSYTINLKNDGFSSAYGAEINDTVPSNVTYVGPLTSIDSNWACSISGSKIMCHTNDTDFEIPAGYNKNIVSFKVKANAAHYFVYNTVTTATDTSESKYTDNTYKATTEVIDVDLEARKTVATDVAGNQIVSIGGALTYTLQVKNSSPVDINITDVNFTDVIPSNLSGTVSVAPTSRFSCNAPTSPGETLTCTMNNTSANPLQKSQGWVTVATISAHAMESSTYDINDINNNKIVNKYKAETSLSDQHLNNNAPTTGDKYLETTTLVAGANMSIKKTVSSSQVGANQPFTYTLAIKNAPLSNQTSINDDAGTKATSIVVKDKLPANVTYVSGVGTNWSCSEASGIITCNHTGDLEVNSAAQNITIKVIAPNNEGVTLTNEANVTNSTKELKSLLPDNKSSITTTTSGTDITVEKTGPRYAGMSDSITYTVTVNNISTVPASNIYVLDTLPSGAIYDDNLTGANWSLGADVNGSKKFIYDGNLSANSSKSFNFNAKMPHHTGTVRNNVEAFTSTHETSKPNKAYFETEIKGADIVFASNPTQDPNPVGAYEAHKYYVIAKNQGLYAAKDINVTFKFNNPSSTSKWSDINASGAGWSCGSFDVSTSEIICNLPTLAKNTNATTLTFSSIAPNYNSNIENSVRVAGSDDANNTTGDSKNITTTIRGSDLKITKYAQDPSNPSDSTYHDDNISTGASQTINFKISVKNDDLGLAKDVEVNDTVPSDFTDFSITSHGAWDCSFVSNELKCTIDTIEKSATVDDIIFSAKTPDNMGTFTNTASASTSTVEVDSTNNSDDVKIKTQGASLNASLDASKKLVSMGEVFTYLLDLNNTGKNSAVNIIASDTLPTGFTYLDSNGSDSGWSCTQSGATLSCNGPDIVAYNGNSTLKLNVKAPSDTIGLYGNSININSDSIDTSTSATAPKVRVVGADLNVSIDASPKNVLEDRNVTYTIHVRDINISTARDIELKQTFSPAIKALQITSGGSDCSLTDSNKSVTCNYTSLNYNDDKSIVVIATMPNTNTIIDHLTSTVTVTTPTKEEDSSNNTATVDVKVSPLRPNVNYQFEECAWSGTSADVIDSRSGVNGKAINGAQTLNHSLAQDTNHFSTAWRVGTFDGVDDYIQIPNSDLINNKTHNKRSISLWFNSTKNSSSNQVIYQEGGSSNGLAIYVKSGKVYVGGWNHASWSGTYLSNTISNNVWHHVVLTLDTIKDDSTVQTSAFKAYLDGDIFGTGGGSQLSIHNSSSASTSIGGVIGGTSLNDGSTTNGQYFKGYIDEVEIYNAALDAKAVKKIYNNEKDLKNYNGTTRAETTCGVDLSIVKTVLPTGNVGAQSSLKYNITVKNIGNEPVTKGFTVTDILPSYVTYDGNDTHSSNLQCTGESTFKCTYPDTLTMKKGDSETFSIMAKANNLDKKYATNTATVNTAQVDVNSTNNSSSVTNKIIGTDLKITKTATPNSPNINTNFVYTVTVTNISTLADAKNIVMTDTFDSRLTYINVYTTTNESSPTSGCSVPNSAHSIRCTIDKLSIGKFMKFEFTMKSIHEATGLTNRADVTNDIKDTYTSNNTVSISVDTNSTPASGDSINVINEKYFHLDKTINKYGRIATIGNTNIIDENITSGTTLNEVNSTYANSLGGNYNNSSSAILKILDVNSSDDDDNITVEYAALFWGGHVHGSDKNDTGADVPFNKIKFITPDGVTHNITADKNDYDTNSTTPERLGYYYFKKGDDSNNTDNNNSNIGNFRIIYGARANITDTIRELNSQDLLNNKKFSVANISASTGADGKDFAPTTGQNWTKFRNYGYFGGWSMVVIYSINHRLHRAVKFKNLSSFSGFRILTPKGHGYVASLPIDIGGFITPLHGDIESSLFSFIQGGDRELSLENMTVKNKYGVENDVTEGNNNTDNIFNDTISVKNADTIGAAITKDPNVVYNVGTDIDQFNLSSNYDGNGSCTNSDGRPCYLSNEQNVTQIKVSVRETNTSNADGGYPSEQAAVNMISIDTEIYAPDFIDSYKECFKLKNPNNKEGSWVPCSAPLPILRRNDILKYRITVFNTGNDYGEDVYIIDNLPIEVNYEENSSVVTYIKPFDSNSSCVDTNYNNDSSIREDCIDDINSSINGDDVNTTYILPADDINTSYDRLDYNGSTLSFPLGRFDVNHIAWIEFNATINSKAAFGKKIKNKFTVQFTNPTLGAFNYPDSTQSQDSLPVESSPVQFDWSHVKINVRDIGRNSVGTKIVNQPFDLNISLKGIIQEQVDGNVSIYLDGLRIFDADNNTTKDIYSSVNDANVGISLANVDNVNWTTHGTIYGRASRELGFDMNLSVKVNDENTTEFKSYPRDFNASQKYAGDVFTTRPASFTISLGDTTNVVTSGEYKIVAAGTPLELDVSAPDINGSDSLSYNATLTKASNEIDISLDSNFSTNQNCIELDDLNISDVSFTDGSSPTNNAKYLNVGVIKIKLNDSNWTEKDQGDDLDCRTDVNGDNNISDSDGLVSCSIDGNSTSIVFKPDHFHFKDTTVSDYSDGFTYMVNNPINDPMYGKIYTRVKAENAENEPTSFFSKECFAYDVDTKLEYNVISKDTQDLNLSFANESNLTTIKEYDNIELANNTAETTAYGNDFNDSGYSDLNLRMATKRNATPVQPARINSRSLKGSITDYLGVAGANVLEGVGADINSTNDMHFYYGRIHAPDYRFLGNKGDAIVYFEVYCKDCTQGDRNDVTISGGESIDSVNWYINTKHKSFADGVATKYSTQNEVRFGETSNATYGGSAETTKSITVNNMMNGDGSETLHVVAPSLPYSDKVPIEAKDWISYAPRYFLLEFQDDNIGKWAGQGNLGHTVDTNVSTRSNRRLNW